MNTMVQAVRKLLLLSTAAIAAIGGIANGAWAQTPQTITHNSGPSAVSGPFIPYDQAMQALQSRVRPVANAPLGGSARSSPKTGTNDASGVNGNAGDNGQNSGTPTGGTAGGATGGNN